MLVAVFASAQTPPNAGVLQQQIERERSLSLPQPLVTEKLAPLATEPTKAAKGPAVEVKSFRFTGNTRLSSQQLAPVVATYSGRSIAIAELEQATAAVAAAYRDAGWVAQAYLPKQDVTEGIVVIQIVEAVFGGVQLEGPPPTRVKLVNLMAAVDTTLPKGSLLNAKKLDRMLLLMDDLPGISVVGSLRKGNGDNETDLVLKTVDEVFAISEFSIDNTGARSTGAERLTGNLALNSPLVLGDALGLNLIHSRGSDYGRLGYNLPVGEDGWRVGVSHSQLSYRLVGNDFQALRAKGTSSTVGLEASYPWVRSKTTNLYLGLNLDHKRYDNEASGHTASSYAVESASVALNGNQFDSLGGGGASTAGLTLTRGNVKLGDIDVSEDASLAGGFSKLRYVLSRQQFVTDKLSAFAMFTGQAANTNLDSSEKFYLGGLSGVRAYPSSEGGGVDGQMLNLELRQRLSADLSWVGFYDLGRVRTRRSSTVVNPSSSTLQGTGMSLAWQASNGANLKATWSRRIGANPNASPSGNDQDGTHVLNRLWLTASLPI